MLLAIRLDSYPSSATTARTRSTVSGATPYRPFTAFETVATDTPAAAATSVIVGLRFMTRKHSLLETVFENV
jgi:hypothetical protein